MWGISRCQHCSVGVGEVFTAQIAPYFKVWSSLAPCSHSTPRQTQKCGLRARMHWYVFFLYTHTHTVMIIHELLFVRQHGTVCLFLLGWTWEDKRVLILSQLNHDDDTGDSRAAANSPTLLNHPCLICFFFIIVSLENQYLHFMIRVRTEVGQNLLMRLRCHVNCHQKSSWTTSVLDSANGPQLVMQAATVAFLADSNVSGSVTWRTNE